MDTWKVCSRVRWAGQGGAGTRAGRSRTLADAVAVGLIVLFGLFAVGRLNRFCLFDPDSAEYVVLARSLATGEGYRQLGTVGQPVETWRPPGLPLLLVPAAWVAPYELLAAKLVVLATAVLLLALLAGYARLAAGRWAGVAAVALVATSPYTLLYGTEVLSEVPYAACTVAVLYLVARQAQGPAWRPPRFWCCLAAALALAGLLRTVGLALIVGLGLWALASRHRRVMIVPAVFGLSAVAAWSGRNLLVGGGGYASLVIANLRSSGLAGTAVNAADRLGFYLSRLVPLMFAGWEGGSGPVYAQVLLDLPRRVSLPAAGAAGGLLLLAVAVLGARARCGHEGRLAIIYAALYLAALSLWPYRHDRFLWPLVPVLWVLAAAGVKSLWQAARFSRIGRVRWCGPLARSGPVLAFVVAGAWSGWQLRVSAAMVAANLRAIRGGRQFYAQSVPPYYYCDWHAAGRWLRRHSRPRDRVLTRHGDLFCSARRPQLLTRFEYLEPTEIRRRIGAVRARYLAAQTSLFGTSFPWQLLDHDLIYRLKPVYRAGNVMILEVRPNRSGTVPADRWDWSGQIARCRAAIGRHPHRQDLRRRLAFLMWKAGDGAAAARMLRDLSATASGADVRLHRLLGYVLLDLGQYGEALAVFRRAARMPEARVYRRSLAAGIEAARRGLRPERGSEASGGRVQRLLSAARAALQQLDYATAAELVGGAVALEPGSGPARFMHAELLQRFGQTRSAEREFEAALRLGQRPAAAKLLMLRWAQCLQDGRRSVVRAADQRYEVEPADPLAWARLADMYKADGTPGKALALLELASDRFPDAAPIRSRLEALYEFYGLAGRRRTGQPLSSLQAPLAAAKGSN